MNKAIGSEWNIWDLHLHTASSHDYKYKGPDADDILCEQLIKNNVKAVAITDHWKIDKERIENLRQKAPDIVFFPGVELRTDKGANNLHLILLFSEKSDLKTLSEDFEVMMIRHNAKSPESDQKIHWNFEYIIDFAKKHDALITIHAGSKERGLEREIVNGVPVKEAIKEEMAEYVDFFEIGNKKDIDDYEQRVFPYIDRKPLIICSDNHKPKEYKLKEKLWIKGDLTFETLKQCLYQPLERVFIGDIPPVLDRLQKNSQKNIASISVKRIDNPANADKKWFDFNLPINPGLVAIIGSKGSGKSAFSDIIASLCKSNTIGKASFLNEKRFQKVPQNYAKDYEATLTWADGKEYTKNLNEITTNLAIEYAQYLPQRHIEEVCNEFGDVFQQEIDKVIFSYVDKTERGEANSLNELVESKSAPLNINRKELLDKIHNINKKIIELENKKKTSYKKALEDKLANAQESLERHDKSKPVEVKKPEYKEGNSEYEYRLETINKTILDLEQKKSDATKEITEINTFIGEANAVIASIDRLYQQYTSVQDIISGFSAKYDLGMSVPEFNLFSIRDILLNDINVKEKRKDTLTKLIFNKNDGLEIQIKQAKEQKELLISATDSEEKSYQKYLADMQAWENERLRLIGDDTTDGSIKYFSNELKYLAENLEPDYAIAVSEREEIVKELYKDILKKLAIYKAIYAPVQKEIVELLGDLEDSITFQAEVLMKDKLFSKKIISFINLRFNGKFGRGHNSEQEVEALISATNFMDQNSVIKLVNELSQAVTDDLENADKRITNMEDFYDLIFGLDYIDVNFRLKMGERNLAELSPGERGIVLLIFYLALSKESKPIIIDQPEDNLDNQSVYSKLVPCICRAKQRRQVIIVTHNPNIAVACDAEQIIYCAMDKHSSHIDYSSGSIENPKIKKYVIDVLEGTMPAFDLRRRKYND